eukprot:jgi/Hompol1/6826/HPOL_000294-RA
MLKQSTARSSSVAATAAGAAGSALSGFGGLAGHGQASYSIEELSRIDPKLAADYPFTLNLYLVPPRDELTLLEFETYALDRLRVLRALETARLRMGSSASSSNSGSNNSDANVATSIEPVVAKHLELKRNSLLAALGGATLYAQRRKDHISHFVLRLAFCRSDDLRQWLLRQETALFRLRLAAEQQADRDAFLEHSQLGFVRASLDDLLLLRIQTSSPSASASASASLSVSTSTSAASILASMPSSVIADAKTKLLADVRAAYASLPSLQDKLADPEAIRSIVFYKVPFEQVCDLVGRRAVLVIAGSAFVPEHERSTLIVNAFRDALAENLLATAKSLPRLDEQDRLIPILNSLSSQYLDKDYCSTASNSLNGKVRHDQIDSLAIHFPPCMQSLHQSLRKNAHLKHFGRLQFGLFLKGIGLPLDEALIFWRKAFSRLSDDEFSKKGYTYGIRYNYGMEGKRTNYTPYSCVKIITSNAPSTGDSHGCPFKHFSHENLGEMMTNMRVGDQSVHEILKITREGHYQLACTRLYEVTRGRVHAMANRIHGADGSEEDISKRNTSMAQQHLIEPIEHPNQWFDLSFGAVAKQTAAAADGKNTSASTTTAAAAAAAVNVKQDPMAVDTD